MYDLDAATLHPMKNGVASYLQPNTPGLLGRHGTLLAIRSTLHIQALHRAALLSSCVGATTFKAARSVILSESGHLSASCMICPLQRTLLLVASLRHQSASSVEGGIRVEQLLQRPCGAPILLKTDTPIICSESLVPGNRSFDYNDSALGPTT